MVAFVSAAAATVGAASPFVAGFRPATAARRPLWVPRPASPIGRRSTILSPIASAGSPVAAAADTVSPAAAKTHTITLLPGDGIGDEIMDATVKVLEAVASRFDLSLAMTSALMGGAAIDATGEPLPAATLDQCRASDAVLLACIGGYKWDDLPRATRPETGLLALRKQLGLFANLRPAKSFAQLEGASSLKDEVVNGVDLMVVRELTGGVYFGTPKGIDTDPSTGARVGYSNMIYHDYEVQRIARVAMDIAMKRNKAVVSVDKANVLEVSQLWREEVIKVAADYPEVDLSHMYVDNAAMQLVRWPKQFDVMVTGNLFGDVLSDCASMLVGSLGMLPSASLGDGSGPGVFEPVHGSAPDIAGQDKANPVACVLSAAMMLRYALAETDAADAVEAAVEAVLNAGWRTGDIMSDGKTLVGCKRMGELLVEAVSAGGK
ncbi:hypothetical protein BU14_0316s0012 [Porphyra umbilicalis]|uniref:3-isopropylmalate dehydrogenase n=1 Tax=Porphyra umbilicalis TaxID=2786 RepID=A0A1X6NZF9_PORUM|nr:hypothetical protein BU14_0316s0012 [Porphyra umbilicalis]|eukprot:OSX73984.1 hypothetical protein BU14_0316s0012 [Porphyra umbilicalis]